MHEFKVVTICGSMRYFQEMLVSASTLTAMGYIVLMPFVAIKPSDQENSDIKEMLDKMHRSKIDMADIVMVVGSHRGTSTTLEIAYAEATNKSVVYA
jgi:Domain of unknown function (DUF4406)